jgi:hypothetical protein
LCGARETIFGKVLVKIKFDSFHMPNGNILTAFKKSLKTLSIFQCSGSMTFLCGSGSEDPCLSLMDPDPAIFVIDFKTPTNNLFKKSFSDYFCTF